MKNYINVDQESGKQFYLNFQDKGKIVMLNLLRFKAIADYSNLENLKPETDISGKEALAVNCLI